MKNRFLKNTSWIFLGNILKAIFAFGLNIITARYLSVENFGLINYTVSIVVLFSSISSLGLTAVITKFFAQDEKNTSIYLSTGIILRIFIGIISIVGIQCVIRNSDNAGSKMANILFFQSLSIVFSTFDLFNFWFRYKYNAKFVVIVRFIGFGVSAIVRIISIVVFRNIILYSIGLSLESFVISGFLFVEYKKRNSFKFIFNAEKAKYMLKISYPFIFSGILTSIYGQIDKFMLKSMINTISVGNYSVAMTLAGAFSIIPVALREAFQPEIMRYKVENTIIYKRRLRQLYATTFWSSFIYCVIVTIFAKVIILILYGERYIDAIPVLSLVVWYSSFSYFGGINNLYLVAENKTFWVQLLSSIGVVLNIVLNFILIQKYSAVGAALASLITQFVANFLMLIIIPTLREGFYIMFQGILCKDIGLKEMINYLKRRKNDKL